MNIQVQELEKYQKGLAGGEHLPMAQHRFTEVPMPLYGEASRTHEDAVARIDALSAEDFPQAWIITSDSVTKVRG